ncbi:MAG: hypothetical protein L3K06_01960 [Thermoplasmata archaeon]|nr:hypothetical protein [Thermoplasmata archaeon]
MIIESYFEAKKLDGTTRRAMCTECGRVFTSDRNFDRHRKGGGDSHCVDPATVGLILNPQGFWREVSPEDRSRVDSGPRNAAEPEEVQ